VDETHEVARRQQEKNRAFMQAAGLREVTEGDAFNRELQEQRKLDKAVQRQQEQEQREQRKKDQEKEKKRREKELERDRKEREKELQVGRRGGWRAGGAAVNRASEQACAGIAALAPQRRRPCTSPCAGQQPPPRPL
jgi:serine/arginine repetitive matrix protein 2